MPDNPLASALLSKIRNQTARVGVIGLGYVGLPLSVAFAKKGFSVVGFDVDSRKIEALERGECYLSHLDHEGLKAVIDNGKFSPSADFARLAEVDAIAICVPTPLTMQRDPDLSYVESTAERIRETLKPGQLVILESTTYPGTTDGVLRETLEQGGLSARGDFFLAFSPEREDPGNPTHSTTTIPKVVGGVDEDSSMLADELYAQIIASTVRVSSAATAEATKLTENVFRAVNIALVNELKVIYDRMGIDIWEVLDAAETKPFGFMRFNPGPGWGGHCIPLDPYYLSWKAKEHGLSTKFIELAGEINRGMPDYVISRLQAALNERGQSVKGAHVLVLGLAYKKDVGDTRESPAIQILQKLQELGAVTGYHDPFVGDLPPTRAWPQGPAMESQALTRDTISAQDAIVIATDHTDVDYDLVAANAALIIDARGVYRTRRKNVVKA